jgi:dynein intermediate chain 1
VGYGSFDFMKQGMGFLCMYSLKNPSFPEFCCQTESGVMCLDWHPQHSSVLCVGLYDGTVAVYDTRSKKKSPIFQSTVKKGKHTDPVWEVCWQDEDLAKNLNFFSVSSDGRVTLWTLSKSELDFSDLMQVR